eukprot:12427379-Karenia_brevis.AAC.1
MWWTCLDCGSRPTGVPMSVGVDGVKPLNSSLIGQLLPPPAGDPLSVKKLVPMSSHAGQSVYAPNNQSSMAASAMTPNR